MLYLKTEPSYESLERMVNELANFGYPEFNTEGKIPLVLKLVREMKYNFERESAANEAKLHINRIKDMAQLYSIDGYFRRKRVMGIKICLRMLMG